MTLKAGRETAAYTFETEHVGFEVDFYHPAGAALALSEAAVRRYEAEKEAAELFIQCAGGTAFNSDEILSWFLLQSDTTLADHLPPTALPPSPDKPDEVFVTFPIRFEEGAFTMDTADGAQAMKSLKLLVRVRPKLRKSGDAGA